MDVHNIVTRYALPAKYRNELTKIEVDEGLTTLDIKRQLSDRLQADVVFESVHETNEETTIFFYTTTEEEAKKKKKKCCASPWRCCASQWRSSYAILWKLGVLSTLVLCASIALRVQEERNLDFFYNNFGSFMLLLLFLGKTMVPNSVQLFYILKEDGFARGNLVAFCFLLSLPLPFIAPFMNIILAGPMWMLSFSLCFGGGFYCASYEK